MVNLTASYKQQIVFQTNEQIINISGNHNQNLNYLEEYYDVEIYQNGLELQIISDDEQAVTNTYLILKELKTLMQRGVKISLSDLVMAIKMSAKGMLEYFRELYEVEIFTTNTGKKIKAKTFGQKQYVDAINKGDIVFGIGPAGTGKTFLAVVMAAKALKNGQVKRIILTRPAVEAGENLGFLPGDLKEKIDPYLRPLYDALYYVFGKEHTERLMDRGVIEIAPLAYMRGRTLDDAFVILDEAQNTTPAQMKMFLTRLGYHSKLIVNGDMTQVDLPKNTKSGLLDAKQKLTDINAIKFIQFSETDVIRHPLVAAIITAYEEN